MTSQTTTSRETIRAEFGALADSCQAVSDVLGSTVDSLERCSRRATTVAAIGLLSLCAAVVLVAVRFYGWGVPSQTIATAASVALMAGGIWLDKTDKRIRADIEEVRRAVGQARGEAVLLSGGFAESSASLPPRENMLSEAIATVDSIAQTAGGLWLEKKMDKRTSADAAVPRRSVERPHVDPMPPKPGPGVSGAHRAHGVPPASSGPSHGVGEGDGHTSGRALTSNRESLAVQDLFSNPHGIGRR
jgi:hypothetical protein